MNPPRPSRQPGRRSVLPTLLACALLSACTRPPAAVIVVVGDQHKDYATISKSVHFGAWYRLDHLVPGKGLENLEIQTMDDQGDLHVARQIALKIAMKSDVLAVIGHSDSGTTQSAEDIYGPQGVPVFLPVATAAAITSNAHARRWDNVFRLVPKDNLQASTIKDFLATEFNATDVVILHDDTPYGNSLGSSLQAELTNKNIRVREPILVDAFQRGKTNYYSVCESILSYKPQVVLYAGYAKEAAALLRDFEVRGVKVPVVLTDGCFQPTLASHVQHEPQNCFVSFVAPDWSNVHPLDDMSVQAQAENVSLAYAPFAADSVAIICQAARSLHEEGTALNRASLLHRLQTYHDPYSGGPLTTPYQFDVNGDNTLGRNHIYRLNVHGEQVSWSMVQ